MNTPDNTNDNTDKKGKLLFPSLIIYFQFAKIMHTAISIRWSKLITTVKGKIFKAKTNNKSNPIWKTFR